MFDRILVPLDGSKSAESVLPYVEEISAGVGAEVILTSVSEFRISDASHLYRAYLDHAQEVLESGLKKRQTDILKVHREILMGNPAEEILRYADRGRIDLIAMASRGSSSEGPWVLGNIAAKVLRASTIPVFLVRKPANPDAIKKKELIKKILLPLDGSEEGKAAISYAEELAKILGAETVLLQVLEPIEGYVDLPTTPSTLKEEMGAKRKSLALDYLKDVGKPLSQKQIKVSEAIAFGSPAPEILEYAVKAPVDLIALSTHGRSGIGRWVFGSVTDKILHGGDTPVLVVPARKR